MLLLTLGGPRVCCLLSEMFVIGQWTDCHLNRGAMGQWLFNLCSAFLLGLSYL